VKKNLAIIFGAKSPEHDVSITTAFQAWDWIDRKKYSRYLVYIDLENNAFLSPFPKKGEYSELIKRTLSRNQKVRFVKGGIEVKRGLFKQKINIDVALLIMHGGYGEDGRIQGMLDFLGIPFTGSGVLGSSLGMDKAAMKDIFIKLGYPVTPYIWFWEEEFKSSPKELMDRIERELTYPLFVKPANAGSSIGITKVEKRKALEKAVITASKYDHKILVEQGLNQAVDINCAVMGGYRPVTSVCEQPIIESQFFSFKEKYLKGGKKKGMAGIGRIIPAPIPDKISRLIQEMAITIFKELGCWGMARMDFLYQKKGQKVYPNEINTIPGSLACYLWEATGVSPERLIDQMIRLALERKKDQDRLSYQFQSPLLNQK